MSLKNFVFAITGASGMIYARTALTALLKTKSVVHLLISENGCKLIETELSLSGFSTDPDVRRLINLDTIPSNLHVCSVHKLESHISSGTFTTDGMAIVPCSMKTLGAIASGYSDTLITRAADVTLKERRPLILVPRETPLNAIHLKNMLELASAGATILPASPPFYFHPASLQDLADFMTMKILDLLHIGHPINLRWNPGKET